MHWRQRFLTGPLFRRVGAAMPAISDTESQALKAGDIWWDGEILSGRPQWLKLLDPPLPALTQEEQAFIQGPLQQLLAMLDEWRIICDADLPDAVWDFIKTQGFLGMIIPKAYGGLGFSPAAHSEVVTRLSARSVTAAVTVMVPNSLGPGELLMAFGTQAQKDYYLPRLADGREIPCFGLTSPEAGSDAAAMTDSGLVCKGEYDGQEVLGIRLNWHKRYITLAPVATLVGLAFKLFDPDALLGDQPELGITLALIPADTPGVRIGARHYPAMQAFQNGPIWGEDVFIPLSAVIGGPERIGQGWQMLMTALAAGRGISLPAMGAGACAMATRVTGAYARIRSQFGIAVGQFEGVQAPLAALAGHAYVLRAARNTTNLALNQGYKPAVVSAIFKYQATEKMRAAINAAMDIHGGKGICDGPLNYLGNGYRSLPIGITVEGANILTRSLIIFGQGAIRCHPYLLAEMEAFADPDQARGQHAFDGLIMQHARHALLNLVRSFWHGLTQGLFAHAPAGAGQLAGYYRQLSRFSAALALTTEIALIHLGGDLKRREMLSARLGDVLSEIYLASAVLKQFQADGQPEEDLPLVHYCLQTALANIDQSFYAVAKNYPARPLGWLLRLLVQPWGRRHAGPADSLVQTLALYLQQPGSGRDRLTQAVYLGQGEEPIALLEDAFTQVVATEALRQQLRKANCADPDAAVAAGVISQDQCASLQAAAAAVARAIAVDHFPAAELQPNGQRQAAGLAAAVNHPDKG